MKTSQLLSLGLLLACSTSCSSEVKEFFDQDLANRVDTMENCFPDGFDQIQALLQIAESWRMRTTSPTPDPTGLSWSLNSQQLDVTFTAAGNTFTMTIKGYQPDGTIRTPAVGAATTLSEAVDNVATDLRTNFGANSFFVGDWTLTGTNLTGSGALTGVIGDVGGQNELLRLMTTTATPAGGFPPNADSTITDTATPCTLTFNTTDLQTDTQVDQPYPVGDVTLQLVGPNATVSGTVTFDGTAVVRMVVSNTGTFDYNVETKQLNITN